MILTTRDRPRFLSLALAYYQHQTYAHRELIVVDDGDRYPASQEAIAAAGGWLLRAEPGTPLGTKLNMGARAARGTFCQKMDDDDWYAPRYLETMVSAVLEHWSVVCQPVLARLTPFLVFDLKSWQVRRSKHNAFAGATLVFDRADWEERPFRALRLDEDAWFQFDQMWAGRKVLRVRAVETFLAVRHRGVRLERGHTYGQGGPQGVLFRREDRLPYERRPEDILPDWAVKAYRELREELLADEGKSP